MILLKSANSSNGTITCRNCIDMGNLREDFAKNTFIMVMVGLVIVVWLMVFLAALKNMDKINAKENKEAETQRIKDM